MCEDWWETGSTNSYIVLNDKIGISVAIESVVNLSLKVFF